MDDIALTQTFTGGRRKRQFFKSEAEAEAALKAAKKDITDLGKAWCALSPRDRAEIMTILEEMRAAGWTLAQAWKVAKATPTAPKHECTLRRAIDETIASKRKLNRRSTYVDGLEQYLNAFARGREAMSVSQFGVAQIEAWFDGRNEAATTRNSNLGRLSALFGHCHRKGYIAENPCKRVEKSSVDETTPSTLTYRQCVKALVWTIGHKPQFLAWLTLAMFVGLRPESEADNLNWQAIDLERKHILVKSDSTKVRRKRLIDLTMSPPALQWLELARQIGSPLDMSHSTRRRCLRALRDFLRFEKWPQDVLRHTAATNLLAFHQDAGKVSKFLGNSIGTLLKDYADQMMSKEEAAKFMQLAPAFRHKIKAGIYKIT